MKHTYFGISQTNGEKTAPVSHWSEETKKTMNNKYVHSYRGSFIVYLSLIDFVARKNAPIQPPSSVQLDRRRRFFVVVNGEKCTRKKTHDFNACMTQNAPQAIKQVENCESKQSDKKRFFKALNMNGTNNLQEKKKSPTKNVKKNKLHKILALSLLFNWHAKSKKEGDILKIERITRNE